MHERSYTHKLWFDSREVTNPQVFVCIATDGLKKVQPRALDCFALLGVYQPGDHT